MAAERERPLAKAPVALSTPKDRLASYLLVAWRQWQGFAVALSTRRPRSLASHILRG